MARQLEILWFSRHRRPDWEVLCQDYRERIERFVPVSDRALRPREAGDERTQLRVEGEQLQEAISEPSWTIALDRRGKTMGSVEFSRYLARVREEWPHAISLLVGSDLGLAPEVLDTARLRLSLGPMTLPHELARLVLYEQLYRALTLQAGIRYHRGPLH